MIIRGSQIPAWINGVPGVSTPRAKFDIAHADVDTISTTLELLNNSTIGINAPFLKSLSRNS